MQGLEHGGFTMTTQPICRKPGNLQNEKAVLGEKRPTRGDSEHVLGQVINTVTKQETRR